MQTPAAYTLLGIALALGTVAVVGLGGVQSWVFWETNFNDRSDDEPQFGASAYCSDPADPNDPLFGIGMDLVLSQDANSNQVTVSGVLVGGGLLEGTGVRLGLAVDQSCNPAGFTTGTVITAATDGYADVDWTLSGYRLDGRAGDIVGDVMAIQTPMGATLSCCTITSLPGVDSTSRRRRTAPTYDVTADDQQKQP